MTNLDKNIAAAAGGYRLGIDIGGTFTDLTLISSDGLLHTKKVPTTPDDYSQAILEGIRAILDGAGIKTHSVVEVSHATTIATNTIIQRKGVKVALITTAGFRDVLEIGRFRTPRLYDLDFRKPEPLVERTMCFEVRERMLANGDVLVPLDEAAVVRIAEACQANGAEAIAICFINSYTNPEHEQRAARLVREHSGGAPVCASSDLVPQILEYERTSTTVINAYLRPIIEGYLRTLRQELTDFGITVPMHIMQSSGGMLPWKVAAENPVHIIESGPAAGLVGAQKLGKKLDLGDLIVFDMGGTTAKASVIRDNEFGLSPETEVGGGAVLGHRLLQGRGYVVQVPTVDIAEVGAGGGSIAWLDAGKVMQVGPQSAGAQPGPVCYVQGGMQPTITDANVVLGYLNPDALCGGDLKIDFALARDAVDELGSRLGCSRVETAFGIHSIGNINIIRALSAVTSERGLDPSQYSMMGFGGSAGVHACGLAEAIGINRILIPPAAGVFSALGLSFADVEHVSLRAFYCNIGQTDPAELQAAFVAMISEVEALLDADGFTGPNAKDIALYADARYGGQTSALTVPVAALPVTPATFDQFISAFSQMHEQTFGYVSSQEPVQLVCLKVVGRGLSETTRLPERITASREDQVARKSREAYFGPDHDWLTTPVLSPRTALAADPLEGPLIVEEYDNTVVVCPGWTAELDTWNNIVLARMPAPPIRRPNGT